MPDCADEDSLCTSETLRGNSANNMPLAFESPPLSDAVLQRVTNRERRSCPDGKQLPCVTRSMQRHCGWPHEWHREEIACDTSCSTVQSVPFNFLYYFNNQTCMEKVDCRLQELTGLNCTVVPSDSCHKLLVLCNSYNFLSFSSLGCCRRCKQGYCWNFICRVTYVYPAYAQLK